MAAPVAVMDKAAAPDRQPVMDRLLQRLEHEARMRRAAGPPAHDAPGIAIDDKGHIDKALPCRDISKIRDPQDIRAWRLELAVDAVQRTGCGLVADRCLDAFATNNSLQSHRLHQPRHGAARHIRAHALQLAPNLAHAINAEVLLEDTANLALQGGIPLGPRRLLFGIGALGGMIVVGGWGDRQHLADRQVS